MPFPLPEWAPPVRRTTRNGSALEQCTFRRDYGHAASLHEVAEEWLLVEGFVEHRRDGRKVFGFFRTLLLEPTDTAPALKLAQGLDYPGNHFFPEIPTIRGVFAGETPWSPRFDIRFDDDPDSRPSLRRDWQEEGIGVGQVAVELATGEGESPTALDRSYDVPSYEFAARFRLRQLPGTLDLVDVDGVRASAVFRTEDPWRGQMLFLRRDLVVDFAGDRRIVQVAWGEREVTVEWSAPPPWVRVAREKYEHVWRDIEVLDEP